MSESQPAERERRNAPALRAPRVGARLGAAAPTTLLAGEPNEALRERRRTSVALQNLRGLSIAFVLMTHASVAYLASAPARSPSFDQVPYLWTAFPIVDPRRWLGFDIFCAWVDVYLMALLFFLSGLFAFSRVERDGAAKFLGRRFVRLGVPLIFGVAVVMPAALYPTYRLSTNAPGVADYAAAYLALPFAPCGPLWFLGVLLGLTLLAVVARPMVRPAVLFVGRLSGSFDARPARLFAGWALLAIAAYVPLALAFTPWRWIDWGVFGLQLSRPALYALYYGAGLGVGAVGLGVGLLSADGLAARTWRGWAAAAAASLFLWMGLTGLSMRFGDAPPLALSLIGDASFALAGACSVLFILALCLRFGSARPWRPLARLSDDAFGVYVLHYAPVVWLQYALLDFDWPAPLKALIVVVGAGAACLATLAAGRSLIGLAGLRRPATMA